VTDTLKFKTLSGRTVYGGGGIMPDVFIGRDTLNYTPYLLKTINQGYLYQFSFSYADKHRPQLETFKTWQRLESYLSKQDLISEFVDFVAKKNIPANSKQIETSRKMITSLLHAYIVRNIKGDYGFYPIRYKTDKAVEKALQQLKTKK
jgi:carboxyl-terminal processing protease